MASRIAVVENQNLEKAINLILNLCLYLIVGFVPIFSSPLFLNTREFPRLVTFYFLVSLGLIFLIFKKSIFAKKITFKIYGQDILIFLFLAVYFLSTLTAINPRTAFFGLYDSWTTSFLTFLAGFGFYVILVNQIKNLERVKELLLFVLVGALIACLSAFWQYFELGGKVFPLEKIRVSGVMGQPNYLGFYLALALPFFLGFVFSKKSFLSRLVFGLLALLIIATIVLTFSRTAWLAIVLSGGTILLLMILKTPKTRLIAQIKAKRRVFLISLLFAAIFLLIFGEPLFLRTKESFQVIPEKNTFLIRFYEWKGGLRIFRERPILGVGPENLYYRYGNNKDIWLNKIDDEWFLETHSIRNIYLDFIAKIGLLGLISFLGLTFFILKKLISAFKRLRNKEPFWIYLTILSSFLVFLFLGLGYLLTPTSLMFFWLLMFLARLLTKEDQKQIELRFSEKSSFLLNKSALGAIVLIIAFLGVLTRAVLADFYAKTGAVSEPEQEVKLLEKSVSFNPGYSIYKRALAHAYLALATKDIDKETSKITLKDEGETLIQRSLEFFNAAVSNDPYDSLNYTNLSIWYFRLSSLDRSYLEKALLAAEKARKINNTSPAVWDNAGLVLLDLGNHEKAKEYFEKAISLKNNYAPSHFHLGETLRQMGRPEEALRHYQLFSGERAEQEIKETLLEIKKKKGE